ncbi:MAG: response regulator [Alphaproteobacteria bacterium]|nr:MAG: response regulator [Alphaproteobacteria bacterium]
MTIAQQVAQYVPYLRRYARALCGTQHAGDAYVAATLEALVNDPSLLQSAGNVKVALYSVFSRYWNSVTANTEEGEAPAQIGRGTPSLSVITPLPRQAFLLTSMEGFSNQDAADILQMSVSDLEALTTEAGREMGAHISTDVLIIEDEPLIAIDLESLVEGLGHTVTAVARTHSEALEAVKGRKPGLILADIQLADGSSGLDAVNDLLAQMDVPVIFITAYPERLLTGERPEPAFLLTKPYNPVMLSAIISQALFFEQRAGGAQNAA